MHGDWPPLSISRQRSSAVRDITTIARTQNFTRLPAIGLLYPGTLWEEHVSISKLSGQGEREGQHLRAFAAARPAQNEHDSWF
jgi:hypothetical protein